MAHAAVVHRRGTMMISTIHRRTTPVAVGQAATVHRTTITRQQTAVATTVRPTQAAAQAGRWGRSIIVRTGQPVVVRRVVIRHQRVRLNQVRITSVHRPVAGVIRSPTAVEAVVAGEAVTRNLRSRHRNGRMSNHRNPVTTTIAGAVHPHIVPPARVHQAIQVAAAVVDTRPEAEAHADRGSLT